MFHHNSQLHCGCPLGQSGRCPLVQLQCWCPPSPQFDPFSPLPSTPCPRINHQTLGLVSFKGDPMHICQSNSARWVVVENHSSANYIHLTLLPPCLSHITPSSLLTPLVLLDCVLSLFFMRRWFCPRATACQALS